MQTVPTSGTVSVIPTNRNYYDTLQEHLVEEDEGKTHGQVSTSSDVFPKVTVMEHLAGVTSRPLAPIREVTATEDTKEESDKTM